MDRQKTEACSSESAHSVSSGPELPGINCIVVSVRLCTIVAESTMQILFPLSSVCANLVVLVPSAVSSLEDILNNSKEALA